MLAESAGGFHDFESARATVMSRIKPTYVPETLLGLESQCQELTELLKRTILQGQNTSSLLIGSRGTGKSACLSNVLRSLKKTYVPQGISFLEIYLNGFVSRDDTSAMREICRQLSQEIEIEVDGFDASSGATKSFTFYLGFLSKVLLKCKEQHIAVLFILDELDLFAHENISQTLLYNLSDLLQSRETQMAIIGLTCRVNTFALLEKRIKSRTSYRLFYFNHVASFKLLLLLIFNTLAPVPCLSLSSFSLAELRASLSASSLPSPSSLSTIPSHEPEPLQEKKSSKKRKGSLDMLVLM